MMADSPDTDSQIDKAADQGSGEAIIQGRGNESSALFTAAQFIGPLPPPSMLAGYENVLPGAADRLLTMAEKEQQHRHSLDKDVLKAQLEDASQDRNEARLGQIFALIIGITAIGTGGFVATQGAPWPGSFISSSGVAGLAAVFITGRRDKPDVGEDDTDV